MRGELARAHKNSQRQVMESAEECVNLEGLQNTYMAKYITAGVAFYFPESVLCSLRR